LTRRLKFFKESCNNRLGYAYFRISLLT